MADYEIFSLGDFPLEGGMVLRGAKLAYQTYGKLNAQKTNAVLLCSYIAGTHEGYEFLIQEGRCFDPTKYFVIGTNMFANGFSSSPSNMPQPMDGPHFPEVMIRDNVRAQYRLITEKLGLERLAMVAGYSMGAQQAFQWAVSYPDLVERIAPWCGHARTTPHTSAFLEGMSSVLKLDAAWNGGHYKEPPVRGLRAQARVYAGWGFSQAWYRQELYKELGYLTLEDFIVGFLENRFLRRDVNNYLSQVKTWQAHNVGGSPGFNGDHEKALASIKAKAVVMPCQTDLYFPPEDSAAEVKCMHHAVLKPIPSVWGHFAGIGINAADTEFINQAIKESLAG